MLKRLRCLLRPHRPDPRRVHKSADGHHLGTCAVCGARIRRLSRGLWKRTCLRRAEPS